MARSENPFRYFDRSPEVIRLLVMMYVKYPLSLRNVEERTKFDHPATHRLAALLDPALANNS